MAFGPKMVSMSPKGKLKCFRCRKMISAKEGSWHNAQSNQIFLCQICAAEPQRTEPQTFLAAPALLRAGG